MCFHQPILAVIMKLTKLILLGIGATALVLLPRRSSPKNTQQPPKSQSTTQDQQENTPTPLESDQNSN